MKKCKRCLLLEAGESVTHEEIIRSVNAIDAESRTDEETYKKRISRCRECENLVSGMCRKCGCYVEYRAWFKEKSCPDYDSRKW